MAESRTKNVARNSTVALVTQVITFILQFASRTIFIKVLSTEYLGINGLFTNILTMLSFAELGIGNAILFKLYKPVAEDDKEKVKSYVNFYKKAYRYIGIIIIAIGLLIIPFLKYIITDAPNIKENITFIYVLFLLNSSISYFFTYRRSILYAYQKEYKATLEETGVTIGYTILQMIFLVLTQNYIVYLMIQIIATILKNVLVSYSAGKEYPFIKDKNYTKISKNEEKSIFNDVKSLLLYKLGGSISNGTDNMIISAFVGILEVGLLSNYTTISNAISTFSNAIFNGFSASVGNLNAKENDEKKESTYYEIMLLAFIIYTFLMVGVTILSNPFIEMWIGKEYELSWLVSFALGFNLYVEGLRYVNYTFRNTLGLFKKGRFTPLISSLTNIILSLILVKPLGTFGVLIATGLSRMFTINLYDPYLLHKYKFNSPCKRYYLTYFYYLIIMFIVLCVCNLVINYIGLTGILGFLINGIIILVISAVITIIATCKLKEFKSLKNRLIRRKK